MIKLGSIVMIRNNPYHPNGELAVVIRRHQTYTLLRNGKLKPGYFYYAVYGHELRTWDDNKPGWERMIELFTGGFNEPDLLPLSYDPDWRALDHHMAWHDGIEDCKRRLLHKLGIPASTHD